MGKDSNLFVNSKNIKFIKQILSLIFIFLRTFLFFARLNQENFDIF